MNRLMKLSAVSRTQPTTGRIMRLYVLSFGYVAVFTNPVDVEYWGDAVINLAFGSEIPAHEAVERMRYANPDNIVSFAGGIAEYEQFIAIP